MVDREHNYPWEDRTALAGAGMQRAGRSVALAEAKLVDTDGALNGHATSNRMILGR